MLQRFTEVYRALVIDRPKLTLGLILIIGIGLAAGLPNFKLDASSDSLTLEHDRDLDYFREIFSRYQAGDFLVVTYKPKADLFSDESLATLTAIRDELLEVEGIASANSLLDVPLLYSPMQSLTEMVKNPRNLMTPDLDRELAKQEFWQSPIYRDMLLSPDGKTTAMLLNLRVNNKLVNLVRDRDALRLKRSQEGLSESEQRELQRISKEYLDYRTEMTARDHARVEEVRHIVGKYKDRAEIFLGGVTMITADMIDFIKSDLKVFGLGIVLFIIVLLAIIFQQLRFVVLPLLVCVSAVVFMLGFLSWIDWRLTVISSNFVALLLITSLAITIHLVVRYREFHAQNPQWERSELVMATVKYMLLPCFYTALTTMVAFVSLVVSGIRPVIDFGWMMTIGLGVAFVLAFVLLPAGLMILPKGEPKDKGDQSQSFTVMFSAIAERRGAWVLAISTLAGAVAIYGMSLLIVDNRFIDYFKESTEIYQGMEVIDKNLGGTMPFDIVIDVDEAGMLGLEQSMAADELEDPFAESDPFDEPDPFETPEPLAEEDPFAESDPFSEQHAETGAASSYWFTVAGLSEIEQLHDYLESLPEVGKVQSLAIAYKVAKDINGGRVNDFELAVLRKSLPEDIQRVLMQPYLSAEHNQTRISMRLEESNAALNRMTLRDKIQSYAVDEVGFKPEQVHFTGLLVLYNNMLNSLFQSQIVTLGAVFVAIMFMFLVLFRSLKIAIIAIVPNILAASVVLGGMGLAKIPLDMMTITIAAITVGIGVDHAIHYLTRFKREYHTDFDYVASMHRSHASIGRAMYYTAITIIVGFSILALSEFIPSIYFGLLTGLAMLAAILGSLTLLPKLILLFKPWGSGRGDSGSSDGAGVQDKLEPSTAQV